MDTRRRFSIFVLDRPTFQNVALSDFLGRATRHACRVVDYIPHQANTRECLLLSNAHGKNPVDMLHWLESAGGLTASAQVCLFNVPAADCPVEILDFPFLKGIFSAEISHTQLVQGIEAVLGGDTWLPRQLLVAHLEKTRRRPREICRSFVMLTAKEIEILKRMAAGSTNADIARAMGVSIHTVKTHVYNLFRKIDVHNRTQATNWANLHLEGVGPASAQPDTSVPPRRVPLEVSARMLPNMRSALDRDRFDAAGNRPQRGPVQAEGPVAQTTD